MKSIEFLSVMLLAALATPAHAALEVLACEPEWSALATELGGDLIHAESATTPQQDPHYIQARPSLIAKVRRANLVICTGADLEVGWLPLLLRQAGNAAVQPGQPGYLNASDSVEMLDKPASVDRALGDVHPYGNPHVQTDPRNIGKVAAALAERLVALDGANAATYQAAPRGLLEALAGRGRALDRGRGAAAAASRWSRITRAGLISRTGPGSSRSATSSRSRACRRAPRTSPSCSASSRASPWR